MMNTVKHSSLYLTFYFYLYCILYSHGPYTCQNLNNYIMKIDLYYMSIHSNSVPAVKVLACMSSRPFP